MIHRRRDRRKNLTPDPTLRGQQDAVLGVAPRSPWAPTSAETIEYTAAYNKTARILEADRAREAIEEAAVIAAVAFIRRAHGSLP